MANKYTARKMFDEGVAAYVKKDYQASLDLFSRAIKYDPTLALFFVCRGAASLKLGRARDAIGDFNRAIKLDATYARAFHLRGLAYEKLGELARAFRDFDRSLEIDPEYGAAYHSRDSVLSNPKKSSLVFHDFEIVNHLMALRLTNFDKKVPGDLAI
ncbi:MAG: tetratricopeptide repeat protein [Desulfobacterales bacterium]